MRVEREMRVGHERGLHLRVASKIIEISRLWGGEVTLWPASGDGLGWGPTTHRGSCLLGLARLQIKGGDTVQVVAEGENAPEAVEDIAQVLADEGEMPRYAGFSEVLGLQRDLKEALLLENGRR